MIAVLVQHKDLKGTILVMQPPNPKANYNMAIVSKIETLSVSFTTFSSSLLQMEDQS